MYTKVYNVMKIITWNVNRAKEDSPAWDYLLNQRPDIALLQEVISVPESVTKEYALMSRTAIYKDERPQRFSTVVLVKGKIDEKPLTAESTWVKRELEFFKGNIVSGIAHPLNYGPIRVVSVYSPWWALDDVWQERGSGPTDPEINEVKLKGADKIWATEILWAALKKSIADDPTWVVGGDFNSSETFDK